MKELARNLRKKQTLVENKLWYYLRNRRFSKFKFRRQHIIEPYIVDFVCLQKALIIELDGSQHQENQDYDINRTLFLNSQGFHVLRFWNNQINNELNNVLNAIYNALLLPSSALRAPSPQKLGRRDK